MPISSKTGSANCIFEAVLKPSGPCVLTSTPRASVILRAAATGKNNTARLKLLSG